MDSAQLIDDRQRFTRFTDGSWWPWWKRVGFRFCFVYFLLQAAPWNWLGGIPLLGGILSPIDRALNWAVTAANHSLFHVREPLVAPNGSGDTSWAWAAMWLYLLVAATVAALWTAIDRREAHPRLLYWLRTVLRYTLASAALTYGIIKLFLLQMPFPNESALATPLGDLLPMRLSWHFIGYSAPYQFFSGAAETAAGLLLLYRPTVTLGLLAAAGAFANVVMINLGYDVPVKLYALHLFAYSAYLLALDGPRLFGFFVRNQLTPGTSAWEPPLVLPWQRYARLAVKGAFLWLSLIVPFHSGWQRYQAAQVPPRPVPFQVGLYDVRTFVRGGDTIAATPSDTVRWRDIAIDSERGGSVGTTDTLFWQRYRRGYFRFSADTARRRITIWRSSWLQDSTYLFSGDYELLDSATIRLKTAIRNESLHVELVRTPRHYQLKERQFHWLSEYNR